MFLNWGFQKKTVKELRKNQGFTARELAIKVKVNTSDILKIDDMRLKDVNESMKKKITPVLKGSNLNKASWL